MKQEKTSDGGGFIFLFLPWGRAIPCPLVFISPPTMVSPQFLLTWYSAAGVSPELGHCTSMQSKAPLMRFGPWKKDQGRDMVMGNHWQEEADLILQEPNSIFEGDQYHHCSVPGWVFSNWPRQLVRWKTSQVSVLLQTSLLPWISSKHFKPNWEGWDPQQQVVYVLRVPT